MGRPVLKSRVKLRQAGRYPKEKTTHAFPGITYSEPAKACKKVTCSVAFEVSIMFLSAVVSGPSAVD